MDTAVDALSHAIEGYMSRKSTPMSDVWAEEAMRFLGPHLTDLEGNIPYVVREDLMYGATTAGMVIAQTGTTLVHGMGYQLTYYKGVVPWPGEWPVIAGVYAAHDRNDGR